MMEAEINLYCVACEKTFTSEGYFKKHNNLEHSVDSAEKKLGREKEEKWKIDMISKLWWEILIEIWMVKESMEN